MPGGSDHEAAFRLLLSVFAKRGNDEGWETDGPPRPVSLRRHERESVPRLLNRLHCRLGERPRSGKKVGALELVLKPSPWRASTVARPLSRRVLGPVAATTPSTALRAATKKSFTATY